MAVLINILASVIFISMLSFVGVVGLVVGRKRLQSFLTLFVAFASGTLLSAAFLHLLPESAHEIEEKVFTICLLGILVFFFIEKFIHWHHCGKEECHIHPVAHLNLIGDGLHNLIDGIVIAAAFLADTHIGVVTTIAIALHEIPQEFGDFSILLHSGMSTRKALAFNFLSASAAILGAIAGYLFLTQLSMLIPYAVAFAAGGFIYIATADLMPELHKQKTRSKLVQQSLSLLVGVLVLALAFSVVSLH